MSLHDCEPPFADDAAQTQRTHEVVLRYHLSWKARDLKAVMALYHPDVEYNDFYQQRSMGLSELHQYVQDNLPRKPGEALEHTDRIRVDGHTAFIQHQTRLQGSAGLVSLRSGEAITVRDNLIWRVNEYATLVHQTSAQKPLPARTANSRLGLSPRQLAQLAEDLQEYFEQGQAFLNPQLDLQQVAEATGYSRNQISHLLNQILGESFYRYVNRIRVQYLLNTLEQGADVKRIDELAFAAGFNSLSAFYNSFRRQTGLSPKVYLKQISLRARTHDSH